MHAPMMTEESWNTQAEWNEKKFKINDEWMVESK